MTRLNQDSRSQICQKAVAHATKDLILAKKNVHEKHIYNATSALTDYYEPYKEPMSLLPKCAFVKAEGIVVVFENGIMAQIEINPSMMVFYNKSTSQWISRETRHAKYAYFDYRELQRPEVAERAILDLMLTYHHDTKELDKQIDKIRCSLGVTIDSYTSLEKLVKDHPSIKQFTELSEDNMLSSSALEAILAD